MGSHERDGRRWAGGELRHAQLSGDERSGEIAQLLASHEGPPGHHLLIWRSPSLARRVQPGQYLHLLAPRAPGLLLPVLPVAGFDRTAGTITTPAEDDSPVALLQGIREGDEVRLAGPFGRGFHVEPSSRHLLVVTDDRGLPRVRAILDEAMLGGRQVTLLLGVASAARVIPSSLLPEEVEYVVATADGSLGHPGDVSDVVLGYEAWADQCFAAGPLPMLRRLALLARGRDGRLGVARLGRKRGRRTSSRPPGGADSSWLQVVLPLEIGCALGVCLGCVVEAARGPLRICREGPTFGAGELAWERDP